MRDLFDKRMDLEERAVTQDALMTPSVTWTKKRRNLRCRLQTVKAHERIMYMREGVDITHTITFQSRLSIAETDRLVMGSRAFKIKGVINPDDQDRFYSISVKEEG